MILEIWCLRSRYGGGSVVVRGGEWRCGRLCVKKIIWKDGKKWPKLGWDDVSVPKSFKYYRLKDVKKIIETSDAIYMERGELNQILFFSFKRYFCECWT
ncbi:hypothetical protein Tco_1215675 [Tanacetum coccineum]